MKQVFTIIVTYNGEKYIQRCLERLIACNGAEFNQIFVVDNYSRDLTCEIIERNFPEVELIRSKENLGFGKANNIGLSEALKRDILYVLLLNQDAYVDDNFLAELLNVAKGNPEYGILSPLQMNGQGDELDFKFERYCYTPTRALVQAVESDSRGVKSVYSTGFANAAAWFMPRNFFEQVGGFSPIFPHYGEDNDLVSRCQYHGFKVGICPKASICHDRPQGFPEKIDKPKDKAAQESFIRNLIILCNINSGINSAFLLAVKRSLHFIFVEFSPRNIWIELVGWSRTFRIWAEINATRKAGKKGGAVHLGGVNK